MSAQTEIIKLEVSSLLKEVTDRKKERDLTYPKEGSNDIALMDKISEDKPTHSVVSNGVKFYSGALRGCHFLIAKDTDSGKVHLFHGRPDQTLSPYTQLNMQNYFKGTDFPPTKEGLFAQAKGAIQRYNPGASLDNAGKIKIIRRSSIYPSLINKVSNDNYNLLLITSDATGSTDAILENLRLIGNNPIRHLNIPTQEHIYIVYDNSDHKLSVGYDDKTYESDPIFTQSLINEATTSSAVTNDKSTRVVASSSNQAILGERNEVIFFNKGSKLQETVSQLKALLITNFGDDPKHMQLIAKADRLEAIFDICEQACQNKPWTRNQTLHDVYQKISTYKSDNSLSKLDIVEDIQGVISRSQQEACIIM